MAYARFFDSHVYVYPTTVNGRNSITCCACSLSGDIDGSSFYAFSTQDMVDHLQKHLELNDRLPSDIFTELWNDDKENFLGR